VIVKAASPRRSARLEPLLRRAWLRRLGAGLGVAALVGASTLWGLYQGMDLYRTRVAASLDDLLEDVVATRLAIVPNWLAAWWGSDAERIVLDIRHDDFQKLAYQRELALARGVMVNSGDDFVPARIGHEGQRVRAKVRLKGDWVDHLTGEKWSYRVKVRGEETLFGMKTFSLQHPGARRFIYEWAFHAALAREDLIPLRYEFVKLTVNGKDLGVYALEEHFDKRLVENRRRREGPILKFDESLHWDDLLAMGGEPGYSPTGLRGFRAAAIDTFRAASQREEPAQWSLLMSAVSLLEAFRAGELPVAEVFDTRKLATYFALLDLLGADHAASWINLRFYYDPIASRLEPIGFDGNAGAPLQNVLGSRELIEGDAGGFRALAFADPAFLAEYVAQLERVSTEGYLEALLAELAPGIERNLRILHEDYPWLRFDTGIFEGNRRTIRSVLAPTKGLHAYLESGGPEGLELEIANLGPFPIEVLRARSGEAVAEPSRATTLAATAPPQRVSWEAVPFALRDGAQWSDALAEGLAVEYRVLGSAQTREAAVFARPRQRALAGGDLLRGPASFRDFAFVEVDEAERVLRIPPGTWRIERDLVLPAGYRVRCEAGTHLDLVRSAAILSRSPLELRGSEADPVVIESSDGTGQGLVVIDAGARSTLEHVVFRGLRNPARVGWQLTGAVTFYRSPVSISHAEFAANNSEDALNLVRSPFEIADSLFRDTTSDAFDADFSDGTIRRSVFRDLRNDAIDVSGSRVSVSSVRIERAGDKGLSAGEGSELSIDDVDVQVASIGVASKDRSHVVADGLRVGDAKVGFAVYLKKSEFGPATMELRDARLDGVATPYLVEEGSQLVFGGRAIAPNANAVYAKLYGAGSG
jgi:hypothetical protein